MDGPTSQQINGRTQSLLRNAWTYLKKCFRKIKTFGKQIDSPIDSKQTARQTQTDRHTDTDRHRQTDIYTYTYSNSYTYTYTDIYTDNFY